MTTAQKKKRFRELAKQDRIRTGRQLAEEHEQPFLPLINDIVTDVEKFDAEAEKAHKAAQENGTRSYSESSQRGVPDEAHTGASRADP
jgi:hypothetical protein